MKLTLVFFAVCVSVALTAIIEEEKEKPLCACTMDHTPVCGADGKTYGNDCMRKCNDVRLLHSGKCENDLCVCTMDYEPVCGDDGVTYTNDCSRECATSFGFVENYFLEYA
ncbi:Double-headed protease inhibitor, submandibular gland [Mizuhopecten yessoensis]|uniref:Double-headed protease inhibitor, submandibular gland n=1 Tax=Mizuhopecten yessoensis TaxID=6573 RepID=A0A210PRQ1_MIZYE|nr:Double-headed protease inhibitor, submandibular gland [Mizuhopecten yessoensis]